MVVKRSEVDLYGLRPTWVEINLEALRFNLNSIKTHLPDGVKVMAVVKADAYGHGHKRVARCLQDMGVQDFGVAIAEEGQKLRESGITGNILVFGGCYPSQEEIFFEYSLVPTIYDLATLKAFSKVAEQKGKQFSYHLKVDTGMGRLGIGPYDIHKFLQKAKSYKGIELTGIFSHLSSADETDLTYTKKQVSTFQEVLIDNNLLNDESVVRHVANSAGALLHKGNWFDMVRAGLSVYGIKPGNLKTPVPLKPVMSFKTKVGFIKKVPPNTALGYNRTFKTKKNSIIATLPVGYADGLNRLLSNRGQVIINGKYAPIVGAVAMDSILVDVTDISGVKSGDVVVIIGEDGNLGISAWDVGNWSSTIPYEVLCGISARVPRFYI
ncbi:MAG: alanine racemase [Dehalococcoidia bacterium]|nr:alanine racemase [Dehalococcoidia bacterium]